jgi:5-methyltetrahydrofolate--homocysteine methyltransferase
LINSITDEPARFDAVLPLIIEHKAKVIALCMSGSAPPSGAEDRVATANRLVQGLGEAGVALADIYVDPCVFPIGTGTEHGPAVMDAVSAIRAAYPEVHISAGVSNVSFGLPVRRVLNGTFLIMLMARGLDTAIVDPTEEGLMARIKAAEALAGRDPFCEQYLVAFRSGRLEATAKS